MISPQIIQQIKDMFPDQAEELVLDKIEQLMETHPDTQESELIDIAKQFRQLLDAETKGKTGQLSKLASGQPEMSMDMPAPQTTGLQKHFPEDPKDQVDALIKEVQTIYPTATDDILMQIMEKMFVPGMSFQDKRETLINVATTAAQKKRDLKLNALKGKM